MQPEATTRSGAIQKANEQWNVKNSNKPLEKSVDISFLPSRRFHPKCIIISLLYLPTTLLILLLSFLCNLCKLRSDLIVQHLPFGYFSFHSTFPISPFTIQQSAFFTVWCCCNLQNLFSELDIKLNLATVWEEPRAVVLEWTLQVSDTFELFATREFNFTLVDECQWQFVKASRHETMRPSVYYDFDVISMFI